MSSPHAHDRAAVRFDRACVAVNTGCLARRRRFRVRLLRVCLHSTKCVYILSFARAGQDDSNVTEQRGMGTNRIGVAGQGRRSRANGDRQSLVYRRGSVDWPDRLPVARSAEGIRTMAYGVHALLPVASQRRVGARCARSVRRSGDQTRADRLDHRACAPAFGRGPKKSGPQGLGRSRGGLTTKLHLAVDEAGRPLRMIATEGQVSDISRAHELVEHLRTGAVIADK